MKELLKSVHICQSYRKNKSGTFFMAHGVYYKLPILAATLRFVASCALCSKPPRKFEQTSFVQKLQFIAWPHFRPWQLRSTFIQSRMVTLVSSETHNVRTSSVPSAIKRSLRRIGHSGSFKVIRIGVSRNPAEQIVVIMYNNVDIISRTYIVLGKLKIRRFQPPHSGLTTVIWGTLSNIQK